MFNGTSTMFRYSSGEVYSLQHHVINSVSDLRQVSGFLWVLRFLHQWNWPPRYSWNIVESGATHHNPNLNPGCQVLHWWKETVFLEKTKDFLYITDKIYHTMLY